MDENAGSAKASERMNRAEGPRARPFREREIPPAGIMKAGEHYVVHAGCKMGVFHTSREVEDFLHRLLAEWVNDNLGGDEAEKTPVELHAVMTRERL